MTLEEHPSVLLTGRKGYGEIKFKVSRLNTLFLRFFETSYKNDYQILDAQSAKFLRAIPLPSSPTRMNRPQPTKVFFISGVEPNKVGVIFINVIVW